MTDQFAQTDQINHHVLPLAVARVEGDELAFDRFCGSSFLIGDRGFALTASHVVPSEVADNEVPVAMLNDNGVWRAFVVERAEHHPVEDVCVIKIAGGPWSTFFVIDPGHHFQSRKYSCWGYPDDVAREIVQAGRVAFRPDLVYTAGHVRRRMTNIEIPGVRGQQFFELSAVAGGGCSGGPIIFEDGMSPHGKVIGIYVGQRVSLDSGAFVGYATRIESVLDWVPEIVGTGLLEESRRVSPDDTPRPFRSGGTSLG